MRNIANKTDGVGDTLTAGDFNSFNEELENAVLSTDQSLDVAGGPDTNLNMLGSAIAAYANAGATYQDSGSANSYILTISSNLKSVTKYYDRMTVTFKAGSSNTGPSTVNVNNLGVKDIKETDGSALSAGRIILNNFVTLVYNSSTDRFEPVHLKPFPMIIWRMVNDEAQNEQNPVGGGGTDWSIADVTINEFPLDGSAVIESNGIFSFASTGFWSIRAYAAASNNVAADNIITLQLFSTDNNSNYSLLADCNNDIQFTFGLCTLSCEILIRVDSITLDKIKLGQGSQQGNTFFKGNASRNRTYIVFEKKSDL